MKRTTIKQKAQNLKKDTALVYIGQFLRILSPLILVPYYARVLGPTGYGLVLASISFSVLVAMLLNFGFYFPAVRDFAVAKDKDELGYIFSCQTYARLLLVVPTVLVGIIGILFSTALSSQPAFGVLAVLMGILGAFTPAWFFQGVRDFKKMLWLSAVSYPVNIALVLFLVRGSDDGLEAMVANVVTMIITMVITYAYVRKEARLRPVRWKDIVGLVKQSSPFFYSSIGFTINTAGATYILSIMSTPAEVGYFGPAERIITFGFGLLGPISQVLVPTISALHAEASQRAYALAKKGILFEIGFGLLGLIIGLPLAPYVIPILLGKNFEATVLVLQVMLLIFPLVSLKHALAHYLLIPLKKERVFYFTATLSTVINLGVALLVVPYWGAVGMASARLSGEVVATLAYVFLIVKFGFLRRSNLKQPTLEDEIIAVDSSRDNV